MQFKIVKLLKANQINAYTNLLNMLKVKSFLALL